MHERVARALPITGSILLTATLLSLPPSFGQPSNSKPEPFEGRWIMNVARSTFFEPSPPLGRVLLIERIGADFVYSIETTNADGSTSRLKYTVPVRGGEGRFLEGPYDGVVHRRIDARTRGAQYLQSGKVAVTFTGRVSEDGGSLRIIVRRSNPKERAREAVSVYERR